MLLENLDESNLMQILVFSDRYLLKELKKTCLTRIYKTFITFSKSKTFLQLPIDVIRILIGECEDLVNIYKTPKYLFPLYEKEKEELFLKTTISYMSHNYENEDRTSLVNLLKLINLHELDGEMMKKYLSSFKNIKHDADIVGLIDLSRTEAFKESFGVSGRLMQSFTFSKSEEMASGGEVGVDGCETYGRYIDGYNQPRTILIISRKWDGHEVIGGIGIEYTDKRVVQYGMNETDGSRYKKYKVQLSEGEVITECTIHSGYLINSLKFHSNFGKSYGTYGEKDGNCHICNADDSYKYLYDFSCNAVITENSLALINFSVGWITIGE